jgi:hypothetical protein
MAVTVVMTRRYLGKKQLGIDTTCEHCGGECVVRKTEKPKGTEPDDDGRLQSRYCKRCGKPGVRTWGYSLKSQKGNDNDG